MKALTADRQHGGIAQCSDSCGAPKASKETHLSDRLPLTDLRRGLPRAFTLCHKSPGQHEINLIGGVTLANEHFATAKLSPH